MKHVLSLSGADQRKSFAVSFVPDQQMVAVLPEGELDMDSSEFLERKIAELRAVGTPRLVLNLRGLEFMDSCGLRSLIALRNDCKRTGQELELIPGPPVVQRLFTLTGTRSLFVWR